MAGILDLFSNMATIGTLEPLAQNIRAAVAMMADIHQRVIRIETMLKQMEDRKEEKNE